MAAFLILLQIAWQFWSFFSKFDIAPKAQLWRKHFGSCSVQYCHRILQSLQIVPISNIFSCHQRRRHEVLFGGGGRIQGQPNPPTPKILFLLGFRSLHFENVGKCKQKCHKKVIEISNFWGNVSRWFHDWGEASSRPPAFGAHAYHWPRVRSISWPTHYKSSKG